MTAFGTAIGLWATAWELGIRRVGGLLPLLLLSDQLILNASLVTRDFTDYRSEDFGRAVASCALALGIFAIRERRTRPAIIAGLVLAGLQFFLILSGNLSFLNWLTLVPIIACFDDKFLSRLVLRGWCCLRSRWCTARSDGVPSR